MYISFQSINKSLILIEYKIHENKRGRYYNKWMIFVLLELNKNKIVNYNTIIKTKENS